MSLPYPIEAIYENGQLKLAYPVALKNHQRVKVIILSEGSPNTADLERVRQMHEQADEWLANQSVKAVREPKQASYVEKKRWDAEFDKLLLEIQSESAAFSEKEIAFDVDEALRAVREDNDL